MTTKSHLQYSENIISLTMCCNKISSTMWLKLNITCDRIRWNLACKIWWKQDLNLWYVGNKISPAKWWQQNLTYNMVTTKSHLQYGKNDFYDCALCQLTAWKISLISLPRYAISVSVWCSNQFSFKIIIIIPQKSMRAQFYLQIRCYGL